MRGARGDVCAHDKLGVVYKLLAGCSGGGILSVIYYRFWLCFCFFFNMLTLKYFEYFAFGHLWKRPSKDSLK